MKLKHIIPILLLDCLFVTISACGSVEETQQTHEELITTTTAPITDTTTTVQSTTVQTTTLNTTVSSSVSSTGISTSVEIITEAVTEPIVEHTEPVIVQEEPAPVVQEEPVVIVEEHYEEPTTEALVEVVDTEPVTELTRPEGDVLSCHGVYYNASYGAYGAMGVPLTVGYSVACNWVPLGTKLYIWDDNGYIPEGIYEVQDTGGFWGLNVDYIDFFVADGAWLSWEFSQYGNININVVVM